MPLLSCRDVTLAYDGKTVLSGLTFQVNAGDYLCVVGDNGSGKSTLMKAIVNLKAPVSGHIVTGDGLRRDEIGYLPQQTPAQRDFPASVREVVLSGFLGRMGARPFYNAGEKKATAESMERLEILPLAKRCYRELSGGQQQRVLLARALCAARKILLLDEPAAGLDPKASAALYEIIQRLNGGGVTIVMISHDIAASVRYASHILHIGGTAPLFFGASADYVQSEIGRAYAGLGGRMA